MQIRKRNSRGFMFSLLIIVISFVYAINVQPVVFGEPSCISTTNISDQSDSSNEISDFLAKSSPFPHDCDDDCYYLATNSKTIKEKAPDNVDQEFFSEIVINNFQIIKNFFNCDNKILFLYEQFNYFKS